MRQSIANFLLLLAIITGVTFFGGFIINVAEDRSLVEEFNLTNIVSKWSLLAFVITLTLGLIIDKEFTSSNYGPY